MISEFILSLTDQDVRILLAVFSLYVVYKGLRRINDNFKYIAAVNRACERLDSVNVDYSDLDLDYVETSAKMYNRYMAAYITDLVSLVPGYVGQEHVRDMIARERANIIKHCTNMNAVDFSTVMLKINLHYAAIYKRYKSMVDNIMFDCGELALPASLFGPDDTITDTGLYGVLERIVNTFFENNYQHMLGGAVRTREQMLTTCNHTSDYSDSYDDTCTGDCCAVPRSSKKSKKSVKKSEKQHDPECSPGMLCDSCVKALNDQDLAKKQAKTQTKKEEIKPAGCSDDRCDLTNCTRVHSWHTDEDIKHAGCIASCTTDYCDIGCECALCTNPMIDSCMIGYCAAGCDNNCAANRATMRMSRAEFNSPKKKLIIRKKRPQSSKPIGPVDLDASGQNTHGTCEHCIDGRDPNCDHGRKHVHSDVHPGTPRPDTPRPVNEPVIGRRSSKNLEIPVVLSAGVTAPVDIE